ncbi:MAG TPA: DUF2007 domain-containing protein [Bacteroidales bacterium]|jgi:hypothetical protein|nr:DUF2007 domain-containing protein [Bacteroidales bacterium]
MYSDWVIVFSTPQIWEAELLKSVLQQNNIECISLNKRDSSYLIGEVEIYVANANALMAKQIIQQHLSE